MKQHSLRSKVGVWMTLGLFVVNPFLSSYAYAETPIIPDRSAPANRQALVQETASGIPLVNITAPTAGGVSRNDYTQFNVPESGAILNNSYTLSNTQLAGYVQGNANMVRGTAKVIVNEVTSDRPTSMNGFLEVAGDRASVVVANPNGITVNGGGFLNTNRGVLTTGKPEFDAQGNLNAFRVENGTINIESNGLNANDANGVDILARATTVNAGVWAKEVNVRTGANTVDANTLEATPIANAPTSTSPGVSLDVAAVGGMYANRITMVGTERGLGVNLAGTVSATEAIALTNNGDLIVNTGTVYSKGSNAINADAVKVDSAATIGADGNATINANGTLDNDGNMYAGDTATIRTTGQVTNTGRLQSGKATNLVTNEGVTNSGSMVSNGSTAITSQNAITNTGFIQSGIDMAIKTQGALDNSSTIQADGQLDMTVNEAVTNTSHIRSGKGTSILTNSTVSNTDTIYSDGTIAINAKGAITNTSNIQSGVATAINTDRAITNTGEIHSEGDLSIRAAQGLDNTNLINGGGNTTIDTSVLENKGDGRIYGNDVTITANTINNHKDANLEAQLVAEMVNMRAAKQALDDAWAVDVTAFKSQKEVDAHRDVIKALTTSYDAEQAKVTAIQEQLDALKAGTIASRNAMEINADTVNNVSSALLYSQGDMSITASNKVYNGGATIESNGNLTIASPSIVNDNTTYSSKRVSEGVTKNGTDGKQIMITQPGHSEKGQTFDSSEFSNLSSGYGAYHNKTGLMPIYEKAEYVAVTPDEAKEWAKEEGVDESTYMNLVGKVLPNYDFDDPIFEELGIKSMPNDRAELETEAAIAAWDAQYKLILDELNVKIAAHNVEAEAFNQDKSNAGKEKIDLYNLIQTETEHSHIDVTSTHAGRITSQGNMTLTGTVDNTNSQLVAGQTMTVNGSVHNVAEQQSDMAITTGTSIESYTKRRKWPHKSKRRHYRDPQFMTPTVAQSNPTSLGVAERADNAGTVSTSDEVRASIERSQYPYGTGSNSKAPIPTTTTDGFQLPTASIYNINANVTSNYLVETDPAFTNKKNFLSSDYMFDQLSWDPDHRMKRLGDGFYEQTLINQQILNQTGKRYLTGYSNNEAEYKALMNAGLVYAKQLGLTPGVALTAEQMAALTSDMVWLEETTVMVNGEAQRVLYPKVYLANGGAISLDTEGNLMSGSTVIIQNVQELVNSGTITGDAVVVRATDITNSGVVVGGQVGLQADQDVTNTGNIQGESKVTILAGRDIHILSEVTDNAHHDVVGRIGTITTTGDNATISIGANNDINLQGAIIEAQGEKSSVTMAAGHDIKFTTQSLSADKDMTEDSKNYLRTNRQTELGTTVSATGDISMQAGNDISMRSATVYSDTGAVGMVANNDVTIENGTSYSRDEYGISYKESGLLSSKKTTIRTDSEHTDVLSSTISGDSVQVAAGHDVNITASNVVGTKDVTVVAGNNLTTTSAEQYDREESYKKVKKSGLMSAGMGIMIGTQQTKDNYQYEGTTQVGTQIATVEGNATLQAGDTAHLTSTDVVAGDTISVMAQDILLDGKNNTSHVAQTHEVKSSGLSIGLGGTVASAVMAAEQQMSQAKDRKDKRLAAIETMNAGKSLKDGYAAVNEYMNYTVDTVRQQADSVINQAMTNGDVSSKELSQAFNSKMDLNTEGKPEYTKNKTAKRDGLLNVRVSIGSSKQKQTYESNQVDYAGGSLTAGDTVTLTAQSTDSAKGNVQAIAQNIQAKQVNILASNDVDLEAATNTAITNATNKSSGASIGVNVSVNGTGILGMDASYSKAKEVETGTSTTHTATTVTGSESVTIQSGQDTTVRGAQVVGNTVSMDVGRNLTVESLQDTNDYHQTSKSSGASISTNFTGAPTVMASSTKGKMDSTYASVTEQAGIKAGDGGYTINVGDTTTLTGAVIDSTLTGSEAMAKNSLTTEHLVMNDVENTAEYTVSSKGIAYNSYGGNISDYDKKNTVYNETGFIPVLMPGASDDANSTTKSAIGEGTITVRDNSIDIEKLNRDTQDSLNKLDEIFDKEKIEERQELAKQFAKLTFEQLHDWHPENDKDKVAKSIAHGIVAEVTARLAGNSAGSGFTAGMSNELIIEEINKLEKINPDVAQWLSTSIGAVVNKAIGNSAQAGSTLAQYGTKWNNYVRIDEVKASELYIVDLDGNWWKRVGGEDIYLGSNRPPAGTVYIRQNDKTGQQSWGWDYILNADGSATYIPDDVAKYGVGGYTDLEGRFLDIAKGSVIEAVDVKIAKVAGGKSIPVANTVSLGIDLVKDSDINIYGMEGAELRVKLDLAYSAGLSGIVAGSGGGYGAVAGGIGLSALSANEFEKYKDQVALPLTKEEIKRRNEKYVEDAKERPI